MSPIVVDLILLRVLYKETVDYNVCGLMLLLLRSQKVNQKSIVFSDPVININFFIFAACM